MKIRLYAALATTLIIAGCVNPSVGKIKETSALPSYTAPLAVQKPALVAKDPDAYRYSDPGRAYSLTLKNADLRDVLMLLSKESGVSIVAERGLRGIVQIEAKNKKLGELLYAILKPLGYTASVENGMILVGRPKLTTRTFHMNYLKDKRNSSSNMNVSGFSSGSVSVSSTGQSDYWGSLENSLEMLIFGTSGKGKRDGGGFSISEDLKKSDAKPTQPVSASSKSNTGGSQAVDIEDPLLSSNQITEGQLKQLVVNEIAGIIQITDYAENLDKVASFLADVEEGSKRQVLIQANIMEVTLRDSFSLGIDWKVILDKSSNLVIGQSLTPNTLSNVFTLANPQSQANIPNSFQPTTAGSSGKSFNNQFSILLDAMKEQGNVNMLSSPKITALNNQKAVIKLTTKQVSWVTTKTTQSGFLASDTYTTTPQVDEVGIFLDVTPQIGPEGTIIMQIHPSVSEIKNISTSPDKTSTKPTIDVREIDTMVDAKTGETIVIAGLISDKLNESKRSVPFLGDIPYLGALFSYNMQERTKTELVIMMTPYILNAKTIEEIRKEHEKRMQNIGGDFHLINNMGSMVTEKSSRDWIMKSEPHRGKPAIEKEATPVEPAKQQLEIRSYSNQPVVEPAIRAVEVAAAPIEEAAITTTGSRPVKASQAPVAPVSELKKKVPLVPTLEAISENNSEIRFDISNMKQQPVVLRETKNRKMIIQMPGVKSAMGDANLQLNSLGFGRAKIARHTDGIWVVLHTEAAEFPHVVPHFDSNGLTLVAVPRIVAQPQAVDDPETTFKPKTVPQTVLIAEKPQPPTLTVVPKAVTPPPYTVTATEKPAEQQVAKSTTDIDQQALYRTGVAAYKVGNCTEAVKLLSSFLSSYPQSPFAEDAVVYRSDCQEKTVSR